MVCSEMINTFPCISLNCVTDVSYPHIITIYTLMPRLILYSTCYLVTSFISTVMDLCYLK